MSEQKLSYLHEQNFDLPVNIRLLEQMCERAGWRLELLQPREGFLCRIWNGDKFLNHQVNICTLNSYVANNIARDKTYTYLILQNDGIKVPRGDYFFRSNFFQQPDYSIDYSINKSEYEAIRYGIALGMEWSEDESEYYLNTSLNKQNKQLRFKKKLIIKPNSLSQGKGVCCVDTFNELESAINKVFQLSTAKEYIVIVQEYVDGREFRFIMLDGEIILCAEKDFSADKEGVMRIRDFQLSNDYKDLMYRICKAMQLRYIGVDLKCTSLEAPALESVILEVNGNPMLTYYYYLPNYQTLILDIYEKIFRKMFDEIADITQFASPKLF